MTMPELTGGRVGKDARGGSGRLSALEGYSLLAWGKRAFKISIHEVKFRINVVIPLA
jgi:hypothetical protein